MQIIIGILLEHQPLYIKGVEDPDKGAQACYLGGRLHYLYASFLVSKYLYVHLAAVLYLASMILSVAYWLYHNNKNLDRQEDQQRRSTGIPTKYGAVAR
jgi:hypothetical protein